MQPFYILDAPKVFSLDGLTQIRGARFLRRAILGLLAVAIFIGMQVALVADGPMHFVPALLAACLAAWYSGVTVGVLAVLCATLAVDFFVLPPRYAWSLAPRDGVACIAFSTLGVLSATIVASLGTMLCRLRARLRRSELEAKAETERRHSVESEYSVRLGVLEESMQDLRSYAIGYERAKRYAHTVEQRLGQLQFAIAKFPLPIALITEEDDLSMIEMASASLFEISGCDAKAPPAFLEGLGTLLSPDCSPLPRGSHPVVRASKGEVIRGELALWRTSGRTQVVRVYAEAVVRDRLTALAIVPWTATGGGEMN